MPEPPVGGPADGEDSAKFAELRRLLIGDDLDQIAGLKRRLDDPVIRSPETGKVLPDAIKAAAPKQLRDALEPVFEKSFKHSVQKHPQEISAAIYPVMGPAIRASIAAAIREFAESLNQIVEKSASWRAIRWRVEARVSGRPYSEILLARSLLYSVEQVFLIHRKSGVLLMHVAAKSAVVKDADMVSGMFTAIQDFVSDSFAESGQELETIDVGRYKLWIQYGSHALLVGAVSGTAPVALKDVFRSALEKIQGKLLAPLENFKQGDLSVFEPARPFLESCLLGQKGPEKRESYLPWFVLAAGLALMAFLIFLQVRNQRRWDGYVDALRRQPGVAITRVEKRGSGGVIEGLKDPKAPDPATLLPNYSLDPAQIQFEWQPYLSLSTPFAMTRELEADVERIQSQVIRFEVGSAKLPLAEAGRIEEVASTINRIRRAAPQLGLAITGHTDEIGTAESNVKLSEDRAASVIQALVAQGIPQNALSAAGVGNSQPLRTGGTEWDQSANRSVSFRVNLGR